jgi:hypothetical protein
MTIVPAIGECLASARLAALGLRHVQACGGDRSPVIVGWVLKRVPKQVGTRLNADLFAGSIGRSRTRRVPPSAQVRPRPNVGEYARHRRGGAQRRTLLLRGRSTWCS